MKNPFETGDVRVTSPYGPRQAEFHKGIDLVGTSSVRVVAVEDAVCAVSTIVTDRTSLTWQWGNYVRLDLDDGRRLYYCHLAKRLVRAGERVRKGQVIGIMGDTGNANGAHLHWELRPKGFSTESLDISAYSGIPNRVGIYDGKSSEGVSESVGDYRKGERVRILTGAVYTNGVRVPTQYLDRAYTVEQVQTGKVLLRELYSWVETRYVTRDGKEPSAPSPEVPLAVGDRVRILTGAVYTNGVRVPSRYVGKPYTISQKRQGRSLIRELYSWVADEYLERG